jgi:hypothetical protein
VFLADLVVDHRTRLTIDRLVDYGKGCVPRPAMVRTERRRMRWRMILSSSFMAASYNVRQDALKANHGSCLTGAGYGKT